jgi:diguanylate cyclase (GGDEF)-like protein
MHHEGNYMMKIGRLPLNMIILCIVSFFGWNFLTVDSSWLRAIGLNISQIIVGVLSMIWLYQAYRSHSAKQKNFWLLLCIGVIIYLTSNLVWFYFQVVHKATIYPTLCMLIWAVAYLVYLTALIYKAKEFSKTVSNHSNLFNVFIIIITATGIVIHFIISPIIEFSTSVLSTINLILYPIIDFSSLLVVIFLYYLFPKGIEKNVILIILVSFFLQVTADSGQAFLIQNNHYEIGNIVDLFYVLAIMLLGIAGHYSTNHINDSPITSYSENKERFLPYVSAAILFVLVILSYGFNLNALSICLTIVFFMIIVRQLVMMKKNNNLIAEYRHLAYHDPLTGLYNRASFEENLEDMMVEYHTVGLLLMDLDRFKMVNDTLGHYYGDMVLVQTAERLRQSLADSAQMYRLGGDEFVIILPEANAEMCSSEAEKILKTIQRPYLIKGIEINITPSIGISLYPYNGINREELFKHVDAAMYFAKESGKNNYKFFNQKLNTTLVRKVKIETELRRAIESNQLTLVYQPKVDLSSKKVIGMEALLRWKHPELGWISPMEFIPIAEETGQIIPIGEWVLKTACSQNKRWQEQGYTPLCVSVNVSVKQFHYSDFLTIVSGVLQQTKLDPKYLELEITESIMQDVKESTALLHCLRKMGIQLSIDDFGTGYSSLNILQKLPIDSMKIDKSFIDEMGKGDQKSMVQTIIDLGLNLNLNVVAEGIEYDYQLKALVDHKCTIGQGYLFSKPLDPLEFEQLFLKTDMSA